MQLFGDFLGIFGADGLSTCATFSQRADQHTENLSESEINKI